MLKIVAIGVAGFVGVSLLGLQGVAVWKKQDNIGKAAFEMVAYHRTSPRQAERHTKMALRACLREKAGGKVPEYLVQFLSDPMMKGYRFAAKHNVTSMDDPEVVAFKKSLTDKVFKDALKLGRRLHKENKQTKERTTDLLRTMRWDQSWVGKCVAQKVEQIRKKEAPRQAG